MNKAQTDLQLIELAAGGDPDARTAVERRWSQQLAEFLEPRLEGSLRVDGLLRKVWEHVWQEGVRFYLARSKKGASKGKGPFADWVMRRSAIWVLCSELEAVKATQMSQALRAEFPELFVPGAAAGDEEAWEALYRGHCAPLVACARGYGLTESDAEDVVAEVWAVAAQELAKYDWRRGSFYTWVRSRVRSRAINLHRQKKTVTLDDDPEVVEDRLAVYSTLFRLTFLCGGYPHEVLAFGFSQLLFGKPTKRVEDPRRGAGRKRAIEGQPKEVARAHSDTALADLSGDFLGQYKAQSGLPGELIEAGFDPTRTRLGFTVTALCRRGMTQPVIAGDPSDTEVGSTCLQNYYGLKLGPERSITNWCNRVQERIRSVLGLRKGTDSTRGEISALLEVIEERQQEGKPFLPTGGKRHKLLDPPSRSEAGAESQDELFI